MEEAREPETVDSPEGVAGSTGDLRFDINVSEYPGGFEIRYSDRLADDYHELVDQSADWLEDQLGIVNLGQIDFNVLVADGLLTDEIKVGLVAWWEARVGDLRLE
jgi:hypothetical protein